MDPIVATFAILALAIVAFVSNRIPLGIVGLGVSLSLYFTGVLSFGQSLAGFGDPTVLFIAALFVVSESIDSTGVTAWAGHKVIGAAGTKRTSLLVVVCLLVAGLTALISVNGAVAALLPLVVIVASRAGIASSQLLLPLAFAAHAGSMLLLTGTPVNIIVSDAAAEGGGRQFSFFEFGLVGLPLLAGTIAIILLFGRKLLPTRLAALMPTDISQLTRQLKSDYHIALSADAMMGPTDGVSEVIVPPRSPLIGTTVFTGMATSSGDLVILAARRGDEVLSEQEIILEVGDTLLLQGSWDDLDKHTRGRDDVLVVDAPNTLRRSVPLARGAKRAIVILGAMVVLLATGVMPPAAAALLAASATVLTGVVKPTQAYRSISWTTIVLIAGMIPLSTAFLHTGAADLVANWLIELVGSSGPRVALLAIVLLTIALGQIISNTATVLIIAPIAIAVSVGMHVSVQPFMMALTVAGAASFLTPIATASNLMVMKPGGYQFGDYWKLGLPLVALFATVAVLYVPLIWRF